MCDIVSSAVCWCAKLLCCTTVWITTLAICIINAIFCGLVSSSVRETNTGAGIAFLVIFVLWNVVCVFRASFSCANEDEQKFLCWASCSGVMVLSAVSFTLITRYYYYERSPRYPDQQYSVLAVHKFGLICLVSGIPMMYECNCQNLKKDKKMIYKVIVDFIDIYEMAEVLALGAPTCTPLYKNTTTSFNDTSYNNTIASFNNTLFNSTIGGGRYYQTPSVQFDCTESMYSALREGGWMEKTVQVVCSFSFLIFYIIYREAMKDSDEKDDSLKRYVKVTRLLQDIPFLVIRTLVWVMYGFENQFIFLVKNVVSASLTSLEFCKIDEQVLTTPSSNRRQQKSAEQQTSSHRNPGFEA